MKKTYGQSLIDHEAKLIAKEDDIIEYRQEMEKDVIEHINNTILNAKASPLYANKDFYIVMLMKIEKVGGVPRTLVFARRSCPTPVYKQSVWKYHNFSDKLEFLWTIPDAILYWHIMNNRQKYFEDKECADLAKFVTLMESGELLEWVKRENGEKIDAVIKLNTEEYA